MYADDLILFGQTLDEGIQMIEILGDILRIFGLELDAQKTKIMTTEHRGDVPTMCLTNCGSIEILNDNKQHKCLGRVFSGDLCYRGKQIVEFIISCAWM